MREIQEILRCAGQLGEGERAVVATVVDVQGSSYRLPGAKMLITESGKTCGTVSGGCLEVDILERARKVLRTGEAQIFTYDTTAINDSIFSLNMGCRGVIRILLEAFSRKYFDSLQEHFDRRRNFSTAVVIDAAGEEKFPVGKHFYLDEQEDENDPAFRAFLRDLPQNGNSPSGLYKLGDKNCEVFFECIKPAMKLVIFGAGADAIPLTGIAKQLGWQVLIVDHRTAFASPERFPEADEISLLRPENLAKSLSIDDNTVAVVMSHNYESDKHILPFLLKSNARYIGALGPKRRTEKLLAELRDSGKSFSRQQLERLFAPVGLDIGATTPETIALSIVAEIQSVLAGRSGGFLRNRIGSIYDRSASWNDSRREMAMAAGAVLRN